MNYNLLHEPWISIRRADHSLDDIPPWRVTENHPVPGLALAYSRPDFATAMAQFLIGLLQTFLMPRNEQEWRRLYFSPPSPEMLRERFSAGESAFHLLGDGARFLQDQTLQHSTLAQVPIANLLIDAPGENTLKENKAFFNKGIGYASLSYADAALALFCLQTNAPAGGQGHRTSLRGGGPMTTLVWSGRTLWENLWLNVLPEDKFFRGFTQGEESLSRRFPWMSKVRTSESQGGCQTFPEDCHPAQYYWAMPRRIWLVEDSGFPEGVPERKGSISSYKTKNYGVQYAGAWRHPLSPYRISNGESFCLHPQPGGIGYRHWSGLVVPSLSGKDIIEPARVINQYIGEKRGRSTQGQYRLWAFGYDMDNMKARCWYEGMIPLLDIEEAHRQAFEARTGDMVKVADTIARNTHRAVQKAWFNENQEVRGDLGYIRTLFWGRTEAPFYSHIGRLRDCLVDCGDIEATMAGWLEALKNESKQVFELYALSSPIEYENPRRIALARRNLLYWNGDVKLKGLLGLPVDNAGKRSGAGKKAKGGKDVVVA